MDTQSALILWHHAGLCSLLLCAPLLARRRHGARVAGVVFLANLTWLCVTAVSFPLWVAYYPSNPSTLLFAGGTTLLLAGVDAVAIASSPATTERWIRTLAASDRLKRVGLVVLATVLPLGSFEATAQLATRLGLVPYFVPVQTRIARQTEDYRVVHALDDTFREPDPLLLWRPVPRYPYSTQRFKGPEIAEPKTAGTFRVISYGDSNTDGPSFGRSWPARLQEIFDEQHQTAARRHEVVNAGVGGYSSYQGLQRFKEEVDRFTPDVILVSFGWNDAAGAIGQPDRTFAEDGLLPVTNPYLLFVRRVVLGYRSLLVVQHAVSTFSARREPVPAVTFPRVSVADYESNLREFIRVARSRSIVPVLLTRPHRESPGALRRDPTWRREVPDYNATLLRLARETGVLAIDVQKAFEGRLDRFIDECHFTNEAHREMAELIDRELVRSGIVH